MTDASVNPLGTDLEVVADSQATYRELAGRHTVRSASRESAP